MAVIHVFAFAYQPYRDPGKQKKIYIKLFLFNLYFFFFSTEKVPWREAKTSGIKPLFKNFSKVIDQKDIVSDVGDSFNPKKIREVKKLNKKKYDDIPETETLLNDDEKEKK